MHAILFKNRLQRQVFVLMPLSSMFFEASRVYRKHLFSGLDMLVSLPLIHSFRRKSATMRIKVILSLQVMESRLDLLPSLRGESVFDPLWEERYGRKRLHTTRIQEFGSMRRREGCALFIRLDCDKINGSSSSSNADSNTLAGRVGSVDV